MQRMRLGIAVVFFAAILTAPDSAGAGIIDFIHEMSGPTMIGVPIGCDFAIDSNVHQCRISEKHLSGDYDFRKSETRRLWLSIGGGVYTSWGNNSTMRKFEKGKIWLFAYEPMVHLRSYQTPGTRTVAIEHGVLGLSYFLLKGTDFKRFDNVGLKLIPVEVRYKQFSVGYTMRIFPNGFTAEQFGVPPGTANQHDGREVVNGVTVGIRWGKRNY